MALPLEGRRRWEKAGLSLCRDWAPFGGSPCSGCSSPPQAPLLFQPTASQGVWPCVLAQGAADLPWLPHPSTRQLNPWSLPSSAGGKKDGSSSLPVSGRGRAFPGDGPSTRAATPLPAPGVPPRGLAGAPQWAVASELASQGAGCCHHSLWFSVPPLLRRNIPGLCSGAIPV